MKPIQQSDQDWATGDWFPRVLAAGLTRMALVVPKSGLAQMNVEAIMSRVPGMKLDMAYFATIEEAGLWLAAPSTTTPNSLKVQPISYSRPLELVRLVSLSLVFLDDVPAVDDNGLPGDVRRIG